MPTGTSQAHSDSGIGKAIPTSHLITTILHEASHPCTIKVSTYMHIIYYIDRYTYI